MSDFEEGTGCIFLTETMDKPRAHPVEEAEGEPEIVALGGGGDAPNQLDVAVVPGVEVEEALALQNRPHDAAFVLEEHDIHDTTDQWSSQCNFNMLLYIAIASYLYL